MRTNFHRAGTKLSVFFKAINILAICMLLPSCIVDEDTETPVLVSVGGQVQGLEGDLLLVLSKDGAWYKSASLYGNGI